MLVVDYVGWFWGLGLLMWVLVSCWLVLVVLTCFSLWFCLSDVVWLCGCLCLLVGWFVGCWCWLI